MYPSKLPVTHTNVGMDPGRDPAAGILGLIVIDTVNIIGALSDLVPIYAVVQHYLLTTGCDCIAVGLSLSLHPCSTLDMNMLCIW